jgi:hypothetical protein
VRSVVSKNETISGITQGPHLESGNSNMIKSTKSEVVWYITFLHIKSEGKPGNADCALNNIEQGNIIESVVHQHIEN